MYRQSEKNFLSINISSTCPHNMVNFGPLAAEIVSLVWGTPANFNGFRVMAALLHGTLSEPNWTELKWRSRFWTSSVLFSLKAHWHYGDGLQQSKLTTCLIRAALLWDPTLGNVTLFQAVTCLCNNMRNSFRNEMYKRKKERSIFI